MLWSHSDSLIDMNLRLNTETLNKTPSWKIATIFIFLALLNTLAFGFTHTPSWQDASEYSSYATHIVSGQGYTLDGKTVSIHREPGYPLFVALFYKMFGNKNVTAVFFMQAFLLGLIGLMSYLIFFKLNYPRIGFLAGTIISIFPMYGYYAGELLTEMLFTFLLMTIFYSIFLLLKTTGSYEKYLLSIIIGLLCGYATLVRVQFLFFLPFVALVFLLLRRYRFVFKEMLLSLVIFLMVLSSWISYVYVQTGEIALTHGREGAILYSRVARTELSYTDQIRYMTAWLRRSIPGSDWEHDPILSKYGWTGTSLAYKKIATSVEAIAQIKKENIHTIVENPGHYIFGNAIELVKLLYLEHVPSSILGPVLRASLYTVLYVWFLFGLLHLIRPTPKQELKMMQLSLLSFIAYNALTLSFLDTIPRYNIPYLVFFMLVGFIGLAIAQKEHKITCLP